MFCKTCGKEINDNAVICPNCGCTTGIKTSNTSVNPAERNRKATGIFFGLTLGLIGLLIGICMYQANTEERSTFMKGWAIGFGITISVSIIFGVIYGVTIGSMLYYI